MQTYTFPGILCNPSVLQAQLVAAGFNFGGYGVSCDQGANPPMTATTYVYLADSETKNPTSIVDAYTYVAPTVYNWPSIWAAAQPAFTTAQTDWTAAQTAYNTALSNYNTAAAAYVASPSLTTMATAVNDLNAAIQALATGCVGLYSAATALYSLVGTVAQCLNLEAPT